MKTRYNYSNYGNDLRITLIDAESCQHSGDCEFEVKALMNKPYIKKQLASLNPSQLKKELYDYGAWDNDELNNHAENLLRWLWISACDIAERKNEHNN